MYQVHTSLWMELQSHVREYKALAPYLNPFIRIITVVSVPPPLRQAVRVWPFEPRFDFSGGESFLTMRWR
jgi:hypothetical protein